MEVRMPLAYRLLWYDAVATFVCLDCGDAALVPGRQHLMESRSSMHTTFRTNQLDGPRDPTVVADLP
jgi:hypothetical protein